MPEARNAKPHSILRGGVSILLNLVLLLAAAPPARASDDFDHACRFWGLIGVPPPDTTVVDQLVTGTYSLATLAASNPNGWSITYYSPALTALGLERPQILRGGPPANHEYDPRFSQAVDEMLALAPVCALAHIRAASSGHADVPDPHPFRRGDIVFAHNGTLDRTTLELLLTEDDPKYLDTHPPDYTDSYIDSELFFLYLLKLREQGIDRGDGIRRFGMADVISEAVLRTYAAGAIRTAANCLVTAGDTLFALRFDLSDSERYKVRCKQLPQAWVVASEPVGSDTTGWKWIPPKTLGTFLPLQQPQFVTVFPPPGPWITIDNPLIDDDLLGASAGNKDGGLDAGETIELSFWLFNEGLDPATDITAVLRTSDPLITLTDSLTTYAEIAPGDSSEPATPFVFEIAPICLLYYGVDFMLTVTTGVGPDLQTWERTLKLAVYAPFFGHYASLVIDGNDGLLQPGEEGDLQVWLQNIGAEAATTVVGSLSTSHTDILIIVEHAALDTLEQMDPDSLAPPYRLAVDPACPVPDIVPLTLALSADWGLRADVEFEIPVGGFSDPLEGGSGDWTHLPGMPGYGDAWHLSQLRNHTPTGSWSWKCGAPDSFAVYDDLLDAMLISPIIELTPYTELRFWHWTQAELGGAFGVARDGSLVEASINGSPWQQIYPATGYDFIITETVLPGPFPPQTPVFSGYHQWRQANFPVHGFSGTVQFRFRFGSNGEVGLEGWYIDDVQVIGRQDVSDIEEGEALPLRPALQIGGPSPFRETTLIFYNVARPGHIDLAILDLQGRVVRHIERGYRGVGRHRVIWDGRDAGGREVPAGLYFYRLASEGDRFEDVRRVIRLR